MENSGLNSLSLCVGFLFLFSSAFIPYHLTTSHVFSQISLNPYDLQVIEETLLYQQEKLFTLFNKHPHPKPEIYIYASTQAFQEATGVAWQIGGLTQQRKIYLQPLTTLKKKQSLATLLKHEYTHIFLEEHFPQLPLYLNEGISAFFSGLKLRTVRPVAYEQLAQWQNWENNPQQLKAYLSSSRYFIAHIIAVFGIEGLLDFLEDQQYKQFEELYRNYYKSVAR